MLIDPGWLFVLAGMGLIAAVVLIPAADDVAEVRWRRDRALAIEQRRLERLARYEEFLVALERREPTLLTSLAASQLNQIPSDREPIAGLTDTSLASASVFAALEPEEAPFPPRVKVDSVLHRIATDNSHRLWLIAGGGLCLLLGLLPAARRG
ncbi:MAG: hypothetical protein SFZ23_06675 [Planctomycetota bacterium]|nr:hypothetical protein [Planctomycetota bacterium]